MKRFKFQLESVLDYKQQVLDSLMIELGKLQEKVRVQMDARDAALKEMADYDLECVQRKMEGMTIVEAMECEVCQNVLQKKVKREQEALERAQKQAEAKRLQVVEARKDTYTLEKLKDLKRKEYDAAVAKVEERTIEDLTATRRIMGNTI